MILLRIKFFMASQFVILDLHFKMFCSPAHASESNNPPPVFIVTKLNFPGRLPPFFAVSRRSLPRTFIPLPMRSLPHGCPNSGQKRCMCTWVSPPFQLDIDADHKKKNSPLKQGAVQNEKSISDRKRFGSSSYAWTAKASGSLMLTPLLQPDLGQWLIRHVAPFGGGLDADA